MKTKALHFICLFLPSLPAYGQYTRNKLQGSWLRKLWNQRRTYYTFFLLAFGTPLCSGQTKDPLDINQLIDSLDVNLNTNYVFPEKAQIISRYLQTQLKNNAYALYLKDPQKLAEQIERDINQIHHDPHLRFQYDPNFKDQKHENPSEEETRQSKKYWRALNYSFYKAEILSGI